jgi:hypothetical protein
VSKPPFDMGPQIGQRPKAAKQQPLLRHSLLTNTVWCITRYRDHGDGQIEALEKHDVTWQFLNVAGDLDLAAADVLADKLGYEIKQRADIPEPTEPAERSDDA